MVGSQVGPRAENELGCCGHALGGFDADNGRDDRYLEAVPRLAEILFHGCRIETAGDLLGGSYGEVFARSITQAAALELLLEGFALDLRAFQDGVGAAERTNGGREDVVRASARRSPVGIKAAR